MSDRNRNSNGNGDADTSTNDGASLDDHGFELEYDSEYDSEAEMFLSSTIFEFDASYPRSTVGYGSIFNSTACAGLTSGTSTSVSSSFEGAEGRLHLHLGHIDLPPVVAMETDNSNRPSGTEEEWPESMLTSPNVVHRSKNAIVGETTFKSGTRTKRVPRYPSDQTEKDVDDLDDVPGAFEEVLRCYKDWDDYDFGMNSPWEDSTEDPRTPTDTGFPTWTILESEHSFSSEEEDNIDEMDSSDEGEIPLRKHRQVDKGKGKGMAEETSTSSAPFTHFIPFIPSAGPSSPPSRSQYTLDIESENDHSPYPSERLHADWDMILPNTLSNSEAQLWDPYELAHRCLLYEDAADGVCRMGCPVKGCGTVTKRAGDMMRHLETEKHRKKQYRCNRGSCNKSYTRRDALRRHWRLNKCKEFV